MLTMARILLFGFLIFVGFSAELTNSSPPRPNILFIVADDLGWNDVGFHNPNIRTPNIDEMAKDGVIFNQAYVQPLCSPSRSSFMTGMFPFKTGLQHSVIYPAQAVCSPLNLTFLSQELKQLGYRTHAIGKWHLGFCKWECTPTYRGFDTYFGYYNAMEDYYLHTVGKNFNTTEYLDYRDDMKPARNYTMEYSAFTFTNRAVDIITTHDKTKPLFMYLPFQNVHEPIQVPKKYEDLYPDVVNAGRRKYSGMVSALDEAIGNITRALKQRGIYDNTLILFTADNGGMLSWYGNNYPFRGGKATIWEGGTRGVSFMSGAGLKSRGQVYDGLIHAVDWKPTLIAAAGGTPENTIDGINQWEAIRSGGPSNRTEFIYNLDDMEIPIEGHGAIRVGDFKLIEGFPGIDDGWPKPMNETEDTPVMYNVYRQGDNPVMLFNLRV